MFCQDTQLFWKQIIDLKQKAGMKSLSYTDVKNL